MSYAERCFNFCLHLTKILPLLTLTGLVACTPHPFSGFDRKDEAVPASFATLTGPAAHGLKVYQSICISCHNLDPAKDGSVGPAIAGSSKALIEARVLHGTYPAGYHPKRVSQSMPQFPLPSADLDALAAFLGAVPASKP